MEKDYLTITLQQCYSTYQNLGLSKKSNGTKQKDISGQNLEDIKLILSEYKVIAHTQPNDKTAVKLWQLEFKRLTSAYSKMRQSVHLKKIPGIFYDSRKFSTFATRQQDVSLEEEVR